jgi:hypothetical protein
MMCARARTAALVAMDAATAVVVTTVAAATTTTTAAGARAIKKISVVV